MFGRESFSWYKIPLIIEWCIKFTQSALHYITLHYTGNYCTVGVHQFYDYLTFENRIPFKLKFHQWREMVQLIHTLNLKIKHWKVNRYTCSLKKDEQSYAKDENDNLRSSLPHLFYFYWGRETAKLERDTGCQILLKKKTNKQKSWMFFAGMDPNWMR